LKDDASIKRYCRRNNSNNNTNESCTTGPTSLTRTLQSSDDDKVTPPLRSYTDAESRAERPGNVPFVGRPIGQVERGTSPSTYHELFQSKQFVGSKSHTNCPRQLQL
jgi:hypothetical protein